MFETRRNSTIALLSALLVATGLNAATTPASGVDPGSTAALTVSHVSASDPTPGHGTTGYHPISPRRLPMRQLTWDAAAITRLESADAVVDPPDADRPAGRTKHTPAQNPAKVRAYWTPARMAQAQPTQLPVGRSHDVDAAPASSPVFPYYASGYLPAANYDNRIGRLYYRTSTGNNSVCSATMVARNLALTAAHCVVGNSSFAFAPGQRGNPGNAVWAGSFAAYWPHYAQTQFSPMDYAMVIIPPVQGTYLGSLVGWHQVWVGGGVAGPALAEGYPAEGWFARNCPHPLAGTSPACYVYYNHAPMSAWSHEGNGWYIQGMGGFMNGGSSGGPVFQYTAGRWYITGVTSHGDNTLVRCSTYGISPCYSPRDVYYMRNAWSPMFNSWLTSMYNQWAVR